MQMQTIIGLAPVIYAGNEARGFWEGGPAARNRDEAIALIITEICEGIESHRKGRTFLAKTGEFTQRENLTFQELTDKLHDFSNPAWKNIFEACVKDTVEDEMADAAIRILDIAHGYEYPLIDISASADCGHTPDPNFAAQCLRIMRLTILGFDGAWMGISNEAFGKVASNILYRLAELANVIGSDLLSHIQLKLQYNSLRPYKHGKKY